jgi:Holliday junction resolvasome RuvABC endonuclease subunit
MPLSDFRVDDTPAPEYIPALPRDATGLVFDQAIRKTGWVVAQSKANQVRVFDCGTLRTPDQQQRGNATTYAHAMAMYPQIDQVIETYGHQVDFIAHEMPPTMKLARPESSLMAGLCVRICAARRAPDVPLLMISKQKAANLLTGNPNAKKIKMSDYLKEASWIDVQAIEGKTYREDQYDALSLFIAATATGE